MKKSTKLFTQGYNCAQSVFCAYCEKFGIDKETGLKLSSSFGGGMGRLREVCGALSAAFMLLGLKDGYTQPDNDEAKQQHYAKIQEIAKQFENKFGSIICRKLLNIDAKEVSPVPTKRTEQFYHSRPCLDFVEYVTEILDKEL